ncbi:MAG: GNAT family N-acetyltransferase [Clostridia bacterium]|nr:GNAT family N-acetyltransferase [Clostridia bacterium]
MIRLEDAAFEKAVFEQKSPIAVPVELRVSDRLEILSFSLTRDIAEEFELNCASDPLSPDALRSLEGALLECLRSFGYDEVDTTSYPLYDYRPQGNSLRLDRILPGCGIIDTLEGERWDDELALDEFRLDPKDPLDRMAVMRAPDGTIVAYAGLNDISEEDGLCELNVEVSEAVRNRGYGTSCTVLLADTLMKAGADVQYVTSHLNKPSMRLAERAGMTLAQRIYPVVLRKSGEDDEEFFDFS